MVRIFAVSTLDPARADLARAWHEVFVVESTVDRMGDDHDTWSMTSRRARESSTSMDRRYVAALDDSGRVVGSTELTMPLRDNPALVLCDLAVHPAHRRRGTGTALLEHLVVTAGSAGRTSLVAETSYRDGGADPGEAFMRRHGFEVAQEDRRNDLDVTAWAAAIVPATPGYVIETSTDDTRDEWLEDRAHLQRRMSTDAPMGDLALEEEDWDVERLRDHRDMTRRSGRRAIESVVRHVDSGRLVAFTQLQVPEESPGMAYQQDTLVLREHRGHGLGLALKAATMQALVTACPEVRTVRTWNATTNGPMIAVNEALGYRTTAFLREWRRRLR